MTRVMLLCILAAAASLHPAPLAADDYELTSRDILLNTLLPGYAQIKLGRTCEGAVSL